MPPSLLLNSVKSNDDAPQKTLQISPAPSLCLSLLSLPARKSRKDYALIFGGMALPPVHFWITFPLQIDPRSAVSCLNQEVTCVIKLQRHWRQARIDTPPYLSVSCLRNPPGDKYKHSSLSYLTFKPPASSLLLTLIRTPRETSVSDNPIFTSRWRLASAHQWKEGNAIFLGSISPPPPTQTRTYTHLCESHLGWTSPGVVYQSVLVCLNPRGGLLNYPGAPMGQTPCYASSNLKREAHTSKHTHTHTHTHTLTHLLNVPYSTAQYMPFGNSERESESRHSLSVSHVCAVAFW